jgi:hypothetical protein
MGTDDIERRTAARQSGHCKQPTVGKDFTGQLDQFTACAHFSHPLVIALYRVHVTKC